MRAGSRIVLQDGRKFELANDPGVDADASRFEPELRASTAEVGGRVDVQFIVPFPGRLVNFEFVRKG